MADIKISPQSDDDQNNDEGSKDQETLGGYKFDNSDTGAEKKEVDQDKANAPTPAGMISAETPEDQTPAAKPQQEESEPAPAEESSNTKKPIEQENAPAEPESAPTEPQPESVSEPESTPETEPTEPESKPEQASEAQSETTSEVEPEPTSEPAPAEQSEASSAEPEAAPSAVEEQAPEEVPVPETPSEIPAEEPSAEESASAEQTETVVPPKKGISKPVLIAGAIALAVVIGAAAYFGLGSFFKGQFAAPEELDLRPAPTDVVTEEQKCPDGQYYNPDSDYQFSPAFGTDTETQMVNDPALSDPTPDPVNMIDSVSEPISAADYGKAQLMMEEMTSPTMIDKVEINAEETTVSDVETIDEVSLDPPADEIEVAPVGEIDLGGGDEMGTIELGDSLDKSSIDLVTATEEEEQPSGVASEMEVLQPAESNEETDISEMPTEETDISEVPSLDLQTEEPDSGFDVTMCEDIPQDDCTLLEQLQASPDTYYLNDNTISQVDEWLLSCREEPIEEVIRQPDVTCGDNQAEINGVCQCIEGYFDISTATPTTDTAIDRTRTDSDMLIDTNLEKATLVDSTSEPVCVNCQELLRIIESKKSELPTEAPTRLTDAASADVQALQDEIAALERVARENGCVEACIGDHQFADADGNCVCEAHYVMNPDGSCEFDCSPEFLVELQRLEEAVSSGSAPESRDLLAEMQRLAEENACEVPQEETTPCDDYAARAIELLGRGDVRGSYDNIVMLIQSDCGREYTQCEEYLALARAAQEYAVISEQISPGSVAYFESQYQRNRIAYFSDPGCVDIQSLCIEVENGTWDQEDTRTAEPSVDLLRVDTETRTDRLPDDMLDASPDSSMLSQEVLQENIDAYINAQGISTDQEREDFLAEYCATEEEVPPPVTEREVPVPGGSVVEEVPERVVEQPTEPEVEEPAPGRGSAGGSAIEYNPPVREEPTEPSAVVEPEMTASTVSEPEVSASSGDSISPAAPSEPAQPSEPELKPAAPAEPSLTPVETPEEPMITEEATPPDIHPVGPEVVIYALLIIASQLYFFRRRIYEYVSNK